MAPAADLLEKSLKMIQSLNRAQGNLSNEFDNLHFYSDLAVTISSIAPELR